MATPEGDLVVTPPRQQRSRATLERIVGVIEELLTEKPFEQITIAEISRRANCAPTAIYSKFSDKNAMLLEVHDRFKERAQGRALAVAEDLRRRGATPREVLEVTVTSIVTLYRTHHRLLRSVLLAGNTVMYERAAEMTRTLSATLVDSLVADLPTQRRATVERDLDFAFRTVVALLQQEILYSPVSPSRFTSSDGELTARLTDLLLTACQLRR